MRGNEVSKKTGEFFYLKGKGGGMIPATEIGTARKTKSSG